MVDHWNSELYDYRHSFVSKFGKGIVELLAPQEGESILDVGCGTGDLADMLSKHGAHVTGIDQSQEMVNRAQDKYPHIDFLQRDVTSLEYHGVFDAVFSNATLHWILSPKKALTRIYDALKQEGRFVAEFGGAGNVTSIMGAVENEFLERGLTYSSPWYFPSIGQYTSLMEEVGFKVSFAELFDRPIAVNLSLKTEDTEK